MALSAQVIHACCVPVLPLLPALLKTGTSPQCLRLPTGVTTAAGTRQNETRLLLSQSEAANRDPPCTDELRMMVRKLMREKK